MPFQHRFTFLLQLKESKTDVAAASPAPAKPLAPVEAQPVKPEVNYEKDPQEIEKENAALTAAARRADIAKQYLERRAAEIAVRMRKPILYKYLAC